VLASELSKDQVSAEPNELLNARSSAAVPPEHEPHHPLAVRAAAVRTAALGLVHALLLISATLLLQTRTPGVRASDEELVAFYHDPDQRRVVVVAGLYLIPFAGIAFVWFLVALRTWISASAPRAHVLLSNVQLVSGIIYTTLVLTAGGALSVTAASVELSDQPVEPMLARQLPQLGHSLLLVFAMRLAAMFVLTTTNLGRISGILPRWFVASGFVVSLALLLTASLSSWFVLVFPAWIITFCLILIDRVRKFPRALILLESGEIGTNQAVEPQLRSRRRRTDRAPVPSTHKRVGVARRYRHGGRTVDNRR
jgi:hypothetical protein